MLKLNLLGIKQLNNKFKSYQNKLTKINNDFNSSNYQYLNYIGWHYLESFIDNELLSIETIKNNLPEHDTLVVIGIGGSYLGLVAAAEFLKSVKDPKIDLIMAGFNTSNYSYHELFKKLKNKKYLINVISKSGTTMENLVSYNILLEQIKKDFPKDYNKRIIMTTNDSQGFLYEEAINNNYSRLNVPNNIGGRFSVLTAVGLFPLAVLGYNIKEIVNGAIRAKADLSGNDLNNNIAMQYALARYLLYKKGFNIELMPTMGSDTYQLGFWWQQLFAESEGKNKKALFPVPLNYSRDLHSVGQYIQDGTDNNFETFLYEEKDYLEVTKPFIIPFKEVSPYNELKLNYLEKVIIDATIKAHLDDGKYIISITYKNKSEQLLGYLFYFFEKACAYSGELLGVNPYNQPGVENYKANMKTILKGENNE